MEAVLKVCVFVLIIAIIAPVFFLSANLFAYIMTDPNEKIYEDIDIDSLYYYVTHSDKRLTDVLWGCGEYYVLLFNTVEENFYQLKVVFTEPTVSPSKLSDSFLDKIGGIFKNYGSEFGD